MLWLDVKKQENRRGLTDKRKGKENEKCRTIYRWEKKKNYPPNEKIKKRKYSAKRRKEENAIYTGFCVMMCLVWVAPRL